MGCGELLEKLKPARAAVLAIPLLLCGCALTQMDWSRGGELLSANYLTPSHEADYKAVGLPPPPMGLRWYHVDKAYVLANRITGLIVKTVPEAQVSPPAPTPAKS